MLALTLPFFASAALQTKPWGIHGHGVNRVQHVSEISRWIYTNECACANNFYLNLQFKACDLHYQTMRFSVMFEKKTIYMIIFFISIAKKTFILWKRISLNPLILSTIVIRPNPRPGLWFDQVNPRIGKLTQFFWPNWNQFQFFFS
jgi:hypothetical protein